MNLALPAFLFVIFIGSQWVEAQVKTSTTPKDATLKDGSTTEAMPVTTADSKTTTKKTSVENNFNDWRKKNKKNYTSSVKLSKAQSNFNVNLAKVNKHNANKTAHYKLSTTVNADLSTDEVKKTRTGFKKPKKLAAAKNPKKNFFAKSKMGANKKMYSSMNVKPKLKGTKLKASIPASLDYSR